MSLYAIALHGGAGTISRKSMTIWKEKAYKETLKHALAVGTAILERNGKAMTAVIETIKVLEDSNLFNAGRGSVLSNAGRIEMDAALMDGRGLKAGAVSGIHYVKNPILLAEAVIKKTKHVMLAGKEAIQFAEMVGLDIMPEDYFKDEFRVRQWQKAKEKDRVGLDHDVPEDNKYGTVGAVALDRKGNLAAGTSTGGMVNKKYGRIGDSPIIGAGTYASNDTCAVSCTGHGEFFIRHVVAHELSSMIKYGKMDIKDAAHKLVKETLARDKGRGGLIAVDTQGNIVLEFNTRGMYRASKKEGENEFIGIYA